jgi:hypothetical protein
MINPSNSNSALYPVNLETDSAAIMNVLQRQLNLNTNEITPADGKTIRTIAQVACRVFSLGSQQSTSFLNCFIDVCKKHRYYLNHIPYVSDYAIKLAMLPQDQKKLSKPLKIDDLNLKIKFFKFCATQNGKLTLGMIPWLPIAENPEKRKEELIEIARVCAESAPRDTLKLIHKLNLSPQNPKDKKLLIEIAKICASSREEPISEYISNFNFDPKDPQDRSALIEIAKMSAERNPAATAEFIQNFRLTPEDYDNKQHLIEIAKFCIHQTPYETAHSINNFGFNRQETKDLLLLAGEYDPDCFIFLNESDEIKLLAQITLSTCCLNDAEAYFKHWIKTRPQFEHIWELVNQTENPRARRDLLRDIGTALILLLARSPEKIDWVAEEQIIGRIGRFRAPHLRYQALIFLSHFLSLAPSNTFEKIFGENSLEVKKDYPEAQAAEVLLAYLNLQKIETKPLVDILNSPRIRKGLKDFAKLQSLTSFLHILIGQKIRSDQKTILLNLLNKNNLFVGLQQLTTIMQMGEIDELIRDCDLETKWNSILNKHLSNLNIQDIQEKWNRTFGASRASLAIFTYLGQIAALNDGEAMESINNYISWVLEGTFQEERYKNLLDQLPEKKLEIWKTGIIADLNPIEKTSALFQPKAWMRQKLCQDSHIPDFINQYPKLAKRLGVTAEESKERTIPPESSHHTHARTREDFEKMALQLIETQVAEKQLELLRQMNDLNLPLGEFKNDLQGQIKSMQLKAGPESQTTAIETDDPYHLLLCGTEVPGSCQRIGGDPNFNRGLLGYLLHGQTRMIAIVNQENRILSRALLRVLWNETGKTPVLFLERIYGNEAYKQNIIEMARLKADKMGVPITSLEGNGPLYGHFLNSFGGPAPHEYCDATRSNEPYGNFQINNALILI